MPSGDTLETVRHKLDVLQATFGLNVWPGASGTLNETRSPSASQIGVLSAILHRSVAPDAADRAPIEVDGLHKFHVP